MQVLAHSVPPGGVIVTPSTELTVVGVVYVCDRKDDDPVCGATESHVTITLPDGEVLEHQLGALCPGESQYVEETWMVSSQDMPVLVVTVEAGGQLACGEWESNYLTEIIPVMSSYAEQCPGDKDGDGDADVDDLMAVLEWIDVLGIDAVIDVIANWGCDATPG
jgi:hypothetical protein